MIQHLRAAAPSLYVGAAVAVAAFLGTRFSNDQNITTGVITSGALAGLVYCGALAYELRQQKRLWDRALHASIVVIGRDGSLLTATLLELLEAERPRTGETLMFDHPYHVRLYFWGRDKHGNPC